MHMQPALILWFQMPLINISGAKGPFGLEYVTHLAEETWCRVFHKSLSAVLFWDSLPSQKQWTLLFQSVISFVSLLNSLSSPNKLPHIYISIMDNGPDVVYVTESWQSEILPSPQF